MERKKQQKLLREELWYFTIYQIIWFLQFLIIIIILSVYLHQKSLYF